MVEVTQNKSHFWGQGSNGIKLNSSAILRKENILVEKRWPIKTGFFNFAVKNGRINEKVHKLWSLLGSAAATFIGRSIVEESDNGSLLESLFYLAP